MAWMPTPFGDSLVSKAIGSLRSTIANRLRGGLTRDWKEMRLRWFSYAESWFKNEGVWREI